MFLWLSHRGKEPKMERRFNIQRFKNFGTCTLSGMQSTAHTWSAPNGAMFALNIPDPMAISSRAR